MVKELKEQTRVLLHMANEESDEFDINDFASVYFSLLALQEEIEKGNADLIKQVHEAIKEIRLKEGPQGPQGDPGPKGDSADEKAIIASVLKKIRQPKDGEPGKDADEAAVIKAVLYKLDREGMISELLKRIDLPLPKTAEQVVDEINSLPIEPQWQIDASHIKNLKKYVQSLWESWKFQGAGGGGGHITRNVDVSSQLDGSNKTIVLPPNNGVVAILSSNAPGPAWRAGIDYTTSGGFNINLVFADAVDASAFLKAGDSMIILYND